MDPSVVCWTLPPLVCVELSISGDVFVKQLSSVDISAEAMEGRAIVAGVRIL